MPNSADESARRIRVLVVDDSAYTRSIIKRHLDSVPDIDLVGFASDGRSVLSLIERTTPDVITLDVAMPHLDGLATLRQIMRLAPRPVIMLSSLTTDGAADTMRALMIGAVDFVAKPASYVNIGDVMDEVVAKIRLAARAHISAQQESVERKGARQITAPPRLATRSEVVVLGASTGGPHALNVIVSALPKNFSAALLIVQHMPIGFTRSLAERLNEVSPIPIKEAEAGDVVEEGKGYVAPGGSHMIVNAQRRIVLTKSETVHGVRPAVDLTLISVAEHFKKDVTAVVLTGMGADGAQGAKRVRENGGYVIAQDEESSVVWGMPHCVIETGAANVVAPLEQIAAEIQRAMTRTAPLMFNESLLVRGG